MRFSPYDMHVETLSRARRTETEEVTVVGQLFLALFARDVYGDRHALTVGVIDFQWSVLTLGKFLFVHQTTCGITEREESVVIFVQRIAVAWKCTYKEF